MNVNSFIMWLLFLYRYYRKYLELCLDHIPLDSEKKANKLLKICEDRKMTEQGIIQKLAQF